MRRPNQTAPDRPTSLTALAAALENGPATVTPAPAFATWEDMRAARAAERRPAENETPRPVAAAPTAPRPARAPQQKPAKTAPAAQEAPAPFTCNVNAAYVYQAGTCRRDDPGSALSGINLCPAPGGHGVVIAGCDGHRLICMFDADGFVSRPGTIYPDKTFWRAMKPRKGHADARLVVTARAVGELTRPGEMTIRQERITHDRYPYPDIYAHIARARDARPLTGPLALPVQDLAAMTLDGPNRGCVALYATGDEGPVFVRDFNAPDYLGVIMPLKQWKKVDGRREALLDAPARPVPAWAVDVAGLDKAPAPEQTTRETAPMPQARSTPAPTVEVAPAPAEPAPAAPEPRKKASIAAHIARSRRAAAKPATLAPSKAPAPEAADAAPVSLPVMATPAPTPAPAEIIIAPAWMAHAYQMHA